MALYESMGYTRIVPFGAYKEDPTSVCFAKQLQNGEASYQQDHGWERPAGQVPIGF